MSSPSYLTYSSSFSYVRDLPLGVKRSQSHVSVLDKYESKFNELCETCIAKLEEADEHMQKVRHLEYKIESRFQMYVDWHTIAQRRAEKAYREIMNGGGKKLLHGGEFACNATQREESCIELSISVKQWKALEKNQKMEFVLLGSCTRKPRIKLPFQWRLVPHPDRFDLEIILDTFDLPRAVYNSNSRSIKELNENEEKELKIKYEEYLTKEPNSRIFDRLCRDSAHCGAERNEVMQKVGKLQEGAYNLLKSFAETHTEFTERAKRAYLAMGGTKAWNLLPTGSSLI